MEKAPFVQGAFSIASNQLIDGYMSDQSSTNPYVPAVSFFFALSLSDAYIQNCELLSSVEDIVKLQYHMVSDHTERVEKLRLGKNPTKLLTDIANYAQRHLSEPTDIETLSKAMFLSRTYLAMKFKKDTGMTLTAYIMKEKVEEGKRLLRYTDKQVSAIASYLGFSSQSHFSNAFRKYTYSSPYGYRLKHGR